MEIKKIFRTLTLEGMRFERDEELEDVDYYSGLVVHEKTGLTANANARGEVVSLEAQLTTPEMRESLKQGICGAMNQFADACGMQTNTRDEKTELQMLTGMLQLFEIPLKPGSKMTDVHAFIEPLVSSLRWSRSWPARIVNDKVEGVTHRKADAITKDHFLISFFFRNDVLVGFEVLDFERRVLTDPFDSTPKVKRAEAREQTLKRLGENPLAVAFEMYLVSRPEDDESFAWERNFDCPPEESSEDEEEHAEALALEKEMERELNGKVPLSSEPNKKGLMSALSRGGKALEDHETAQRNGMIMFQQQQLVKKYGNFTTLLEADTTSGIFGKTCCWFLDPPKSESGPIPLGRMADLLENLHRDIVEGEGVQLWGEMQLEVDEDDPCLGGDYAETMQALEAIGATEIIAVFQHLEGRIRAAGFDAASSEGWEEFFENSTCDKEDTQLYDLGQALPDQLQAYAKANPDLVQAGEKYVAEETERRPLEFVDGQELLNSLLGGGGAMMKSMMGQMEKSIGRLGQIEGMEDAPMPDLEGLENLQMPPEVSAAQLKIYERDRQRMMQEYGSLDGAVASAPDDQLLHIMALIGGSLDESTNPAPPEASLMALRLSDVSQFLEIDFSSWFESCSPEEIVSGINDLQAIGAPIGDRLAHAYKAGQAAGGETDEWFDWDDFFFENEGMEPEEKEMESLVAAIPQHFREYWKTRPHGSLC